MDKYDPAKIEPKWQKEWEKEKLDSVDIKGAKKPFYNLMMFPYPSAEGLHVGNMYAFTASDIYGRFKRFQGFNVFEPIGLDGFGIHSENYALKIGRHPKEHAAITEKNFYTQLHKIGAMFDWTKTVETYSPDYYKWTQWLFIRMFKAGLAYRGKAKVNFCPKCKTVLSDEQVVDGKCERCGTEVVKKEMEQWFFRITDYAEKLLSNLETLDWTEKIKTTQKNWIGRKPGRKIMFDDIEIFTTRPDTVYGATFVVLAPDHPLAGKVKSVVNPATKKEIPVFVDEYVVGGVGTGAIMGVPAHDERDLAFAKAHNLPIVEVFDKQGNMINSGPWNGLKNTEAFGKIGKPATIYHLRDWLVSRQRYWGAPIPMIYCAKDGWQAVAEKDLPVLLPNIQDYQPEGSGQGPLAKHKEFFETTCPKCKGPARRETDVCDTFLDSSWYYLRYPSVGDNKEPFSPQLTKKWLPVDMYTGGAEHAVLHLMYSRFVTMVLHDLKLLDFDEPFKRFFAHGLLIKDGAKMSKSKGNVINPDEYIAKYGADAIRLYLMFMGPVDMGGDFRDSGMQGMRRWVERVWTTINNQIATPGTDGETEANKLIQKVSNDIELRHYNTAISAMMVFINSLTGKSVSREVVGKFLVVLAPFAPHLAEELWHELGNQTSVHRQSWPEPVEGLEEKEIIVIVAVNNKPRAKLTFGSKEAGVLKEAEVVLAAKNDARVQKYLASRPVKRVVYVPGRILNLVV